VHDVCKQIAALLHDARARVLAFKLHPWS